jgi:nitrite reductase/ring-hydroxylating ferredoxin subunit
MYKRYIIGILLGLVFLFSGCAKEDTGLPNVFVDFRVFMNDPNYFALNGPGGFAFVDNQGIAGVVIYNTGYGFRAFDRCSTVNPEERCAVELDETGLSLVDPCSGAKFDLATGIPTKAPAEKLLRQYHVSVMGNVLRITN